MRSFCAAISALSSAAFAFATANDASAFSPFSRSATSAAFRAVTSSGSASKTGAMETRESHSGRFVAP
jgi:hypothetical protein